MAGDCGTWLGLDLKIFILTSQRPAKSHYMVCVKRDLSCVKETYNMSKDTSYQVKVTIQRTLENRMMKVSVLAHLICAVKLLNVMCQKRPIMCQMRLSMCRKSPNT